MNYPHMSLPGGYGNVTKNRSGFFLLFLSWAALVFGSTQAWAQQDPPVVNPIPSHEVTVSVDSENHVNHKREPRVVWKHVVRVKEAEWLRLNFKYLVLADDPYSGTSSYLRITSLKDGHQQILDSKSARQWRNTSAYLNGNSVRLELTAWPNGRLNRVAIDTVTAGDVPEEDPKETICDNVDDRVLSNDARVGRTVPGGCTAWLFNNSKHCMLTAGHCASSTEVIEFNVPLSNSNGSYNHPGPDDQYVVDLTSMQFVSGGIGNDWCYFGCFENSNTGLTAFQAQGASFALELPPSVASGDEIRITGHGSTSSPVSPTWNGAQKTHVGPYQLFTGSELGYRTDTTGGNSGSPVIFENDGTAIGIHTHGGCGGGGSGNNSGTGANNGGLQNALANPLGICQGGLDFNYPNGRPTLLNPAGGTTIRVVVLDGGEAPQPGTGMLHWDDGSGFQAVSMTEISPNVYDAVFPATPCGAVVKYFVSALAVSGDQFADPVGAPASSYEVISATSISIGFNDNFESDLGWTVSGNASDGQWDRGLPIGGGDRGDPPTDADGSGNCYLTDNVDGNSDVDGGSTLLTSPVFDASVASGQEVLVSYYRWFSNDTGSGAMEDVFVVDISNDGGTTWSNLETVGPAGTEVSGAWFLKSFKISDTIAPTNQMRLRFTASDLGTGSVVEAGVDGVQIHLVNCVEQVSPDALNVLLGNLDSGGVPELIDSDDLYANLDPQFLSNRYQLIFTVDAVSSTDTPSEMSFTMESGVTNVVGTIQQKIELYNYINGQFEVVDTRTATTNDSVAMFTPPGDALRFVENGTGAMQARITYQNDIPFWVFRVFNLYLPFDARVDQIQWEITP